MPSDDKQAEADAAWTKFLDAANAAEWDECDDAIDALCGVYDAYCNDGGPVPRDWAYLKYLAPGGEQEGVGKMIDRLQALSLLISDLKVRQEESADLAALAERVKRNGWHDLARRLSPRDAEPIEELPHAVYGGYPLFYVARDGGIFCPTCANSEACRNADPESDAQWDLASQVCHWEGPPLACDNCNGPIESAYGDPDEKGVGDE